MKMVQELRLVIRENGNVIETIVKETNTEPSNLVQSLEEFQRSANTAITKMIENLGELGDAMETDEESDEEEEENIPVTPKKVKK